MTGAERRKWTVADVFFILLAILSLLGIFLRFWGMRNRGERELREYTVGAEWKNVDGRTVAPLREGELLYTASGELFGRVVSVEQKPSVVELKKDGKIYRVESEERCDVQIYLSTMCRESDGQILREGREALMIGQTFSVYTMTAQMSVRITSIGENVPFS